VAGIENIVRLISYTIQLLWVTYAYRGVYLDTVLMIFLRDGTSDTLYH
jgi:hypothetical protein